MSDRLRILPVTEGRYLLVIDDVDAEHAEEYGQLGSIRDLDGNGLAGCAGALVFDRTVRIGDDQ